MKIPSSFSVGGYTYNVEYSPKYMFNNGECDFQNETITLSSAVSESQQMRTFLHEMTHALLVAIGKKDLNDDEEFVDTVANHLYQIIKTVKYE